MSKASDFFGGGIAAIGQIVEFSLSFGNEFVVKNERFLREGFAETDTNNISPIFPLDYVISGGVNTFSETLGTVGADNDIVVILKNGTTDYFLSTDNGENFVQKASTGDFFRAQSHSSIDINPNTGVIIACTEQNAAIKRSTDNGLTFTQSVLEAAQSGNVVSILHLSSNIWVASRGTGGELYRSTDDGASWSAPIVNPAGANGVGVMAYNPVTDVVITSGQNGNMARSTNGGVSYSSVAGLPVAGADALAYIGEDGGNHTWLNLANSNLSTKSTDDGATWTVDGALVDLNILNDPSGIWADLNGKVIIATTDSDLYLSNDFGKTYSLIGNVKTNKLIGFSESNGRLFGGSQFYSAPNEIEPYVFLDLGVSLPASEFSDGSRCMRIK